VLLYEHGLLRDVMWLWVERVVRNGPLTMVVEEALLWLLLLLGAVGEAEQAVTRCSHC